MGRGRTLAEFQKEFPDEARCAGFLARRWPDGFVCPACCRGGAVALKSRPRLLECLDCGRQTSLTAGTAMHRSKLPLTMWFWAAHLMATHSNGMSARQLEDQLGVTYKTAWLLAQKLRRSMVDPDRDLLEGVVEVDQTEFPSAPATRSSSPAPPAKSWSPADRSDRSQRRQAQAEAQGREISRHPFGPAAPGRDRRQLGQIDRGFRARQCEARRDADHRRSRRLSGALGRLPPRSARCREHGGQHCPALEPPRLLVAEALGAGDVSCLRRKHVDAYLEEFVFRYNRRFYRHVSFETVLGSPRAAAQRPTATSSTRRQPTKRQLATTHYL